jgi:hypothetical protein
MMLFAMRMLVLAKLVVVRSMPNVIHGTQNGQQNWKKRQPDRATNCYHRNKSNEYHLGDEQQNMNSCLSALVFEEN